MAERRWADATAVTHEQVDLIAALARLREVISAVSVDLLGGGRLTARRWDELADILTEAARLCREQGSGME